jgi:hypothetical protein
MIIFRNNIRNHRQQNKKEPSFNHHPRKFLIAFIFIMMLGAFFTAASVSAQSQIWMEVNQALGVQKDDHQFFVAGKNTVVRIFWKETVMIDPANTWVNVSRDGQQVFKLIPKKTTGYVSTVDFMCRNMASCGNWAAGAYTFQAEINGVKFNPFPLPYTFSTGQPLRILAVAVKANYGSGGIKSISDEKWKTMGEFTQNVYPLAEKNLRWIICPTILDASGASYNLAKSDWTGRQNLSNALTNLIPAKCKTSPQSNGCYDVVVGFIKESIRQDDGTGLAGYAFLDSKSVVAVAGDDDAPGTVAHEIAHKYGIGDTYDGAKISSIRCSVNPAPNGFQGLDWDKGLTGLISCTAGRPASTLWGIGLQRISGAQVAASDHPYEVSGRGALPEMADFMSAGGAWQNQLWITKDTYDWLFRRLVKQEPGLKIVSRVLTASATTQRFVSFSGTLSQTNTVELNPWKSYMDTVTLGDSTGSFMMQAVNASGSILASTSFTVSFFMVHPPRTLTQAPFEGVINFPAGTVKFQIVKDGTVLAEVPVSANAPTITGVTPQTTTTLSGSYTITWTGNDPDGDKLTYTVEYNPDVTNASSAWMILVDGLEASSWTQDFGELPGGNHAKIRVTAYDGVLYATAESAEFIVPLKKPEVFLDELPWGTTYNPGDDILLTAEAYDSQDGWLPDDKIRWTSDISGELGYGSELLVQNLEAGRHTITVTATNSAGLSSSAEVIVQVGSSTGSGHCFIATAAYGSYLHPFVQVLRAFRDKVLLVSSPGRSFVAWYYQVSQPIAGVIARHNMLSAGVRIALLPAIGLAWLCLQVEVVPVALMLLAFGALLAIVIRIRWRRLSTPTP